jgi:TatA/E family protein of Tat protein translocase
VFSLSPIKILVIVSVVLLLLGPDKLPEVAHKLGSSWRAIKRLQEKVETEIRDALPDLPSSGDIARIARSPVNLLNQLADRVDAKEEEAQSTSDANGAPTAIDVPAAPFIDPPPVGVPHVERPVVSSPSSDPSLN